MSVALIAAISKNNVIGSDNKLVWRNKEDANHFRDLTTGNIVIMGRKTFESIFDYLKKPLPNRLNVVITRQKDYQAPDGVEVFQNIQEALAAHKNEDIYIAGGGEIYNQTINLADTLYITHIDQDLEGDTKFPVIDPKQWRQSTNEQRDGFSFATYKRI
ncbi:MAG: dihydrofolate reductase [bacterium]|nr:dihydrofolate reductase [bacterium]